MKRHLMPLTEQEMTWIAASLAALLASMKEAGVRPPYGMLDLPMKFDRRLDAIRLLKEAERRRHKKLMP